MSRRHHVNLDVRVRSAVTHAGRAFAHGATAVSKAFAQWFRRLVPQRSRGGALAHHDRLIDKKGDRYIEEVTMVDTGEVTHSVSEPLTKHQGHGSAKKPRSPTS